MISIGSEVGGGGGGGGKLSLWFDPALDPRVGVPAGLELTAGGAGGGCEGLEGEPSTLKENSKNLSHLSHNFLKLLDSILRNY